MRVGSVGRCISDGDYGGGGGSWAVAADGSPLLVAGGGGGGGHGGYGGKAASLPGGGGQEGAGWHSDLPTYADGDDYRCAKAAVFVGFLGGFRPSFRDTFSPGAKTVKTGEKWRKTGA